MLPKPLSHGIVLLNRVQLPIQARALNFSHLSHGEREVSIERGDVEKIAYLARIQVTESELDKVTADLSRILNLVDQMGAVSTEGVEPLSNPLDMVQRLRADAVTEPNQRDRFQAIAPATEAGLYLVPKVIE